MSAIGFIHVSLYARFRFPAAVLAQRRSSLASQFQTRMIPVSFLSTPGRSDRHGSAEPRPYGSFELREAFQLHHGGSLAPVRVAYTVQGPKEGPLVVALGGISATCRVADDNVGRGWWGRLFGPNKAIDTSRLRLVSFAFLGGSAGTTGSPLSPANAGLEAHDRDQDWRQGACGPSGTKGSPALLKVSTFDQARILAALLDHLDIAAVDQFIGASYGGMVALAFASLYPERVRGLTIISAAHRATPMGTAWRSIQRRIVEILGEQGLAEEGLALARALAMTTYRTPEEFEQRFGAPPPEAQSDNDFPVWQYLKARGAEYPSHMAPEAFITLSQSIDLHAVEPERILCPMMVVAVNKDPLAPPALCGELARRAGGRAEIFSLDSIYGHDAFLKEDHFFAQLFKNIEGGIDS